MTAQKIVTTCCICGNTMRIFLCDNYQTIHICEECKEAIIYAKELKKLHTDDRK